MTGKHSGFVILDRKYKHIKTISRCACARACGTRGCVILTF